MKDSISIVISTWQRKDLLEKILIQLIKEVENVENITCEIIVCDSGSKDGTDQLMNNFSAGEVALIYANDCVNTLSGKRNRGIDLATGSKIILLDDDVIPQSNFVKNHLKALQKYGEKSIVCGQVRYPTEWVNASNYFRYKDGRHLGKRRVSFDLKNLPFYLIVAMNMSFFKQPVIDMGKFNEKFSSYGGEDIEFGYRASKHGFRIVYCNEIESLHYEGHGSLNQYVNKLFKSSSTGMDLLNHIDPEIIKNTPLAVIENENSYVYRVSNILSLVRLEKYIVKFLNYTDRSKILFFPTLYKICTAIYHVNGQKSRKLQSKNHEWI